MGIFSPVSVGMSTMTPHNACDDDDDDDEDDDIYIMMKFCLFVCNEK